MNFGSDARYSLPATRYPLLSVAEEVFDFAEDTLGLRWFFAADVGKFAQVVFLLLGEVGRDTDLNVDVVIAAASSVEKGDPFSAETNDLVGLRSRWNLQLLGTMDRVRLELSSKRR